MTGADHDPPGGRTPNPRMRFLAVAIISAALLAGWAVLSTLRGGDAGSPPETAAPTAPPPSSGGGGGEVSPLDFGAVGDGEADDTQAMKDALAALEPGGVLRIPADRTFRHNDVLEVETPAVSILGTGTLLAGDEERSAVALRADDIVVDGPTFAIDDTSKRWVAYEQMKLRISKSSGVVVRNVRIRGSAAAGIYVGGATDFVIDSATISDTRADGIHVTTGSTGGTLGRIVVERPGDDGVAFVSYRESGMVSDMEVSSAEVRDQVWGRSFSVVGGTDIRFRDIVSQGSAGAAVYIAAESEFDSEGVNGVSVAGATLTDSNRQAAEDNDERPSPDKELVAHGAILLYNSQGDEVISEVSITDVQIAATQGSGPQVRLDSSRGGGITGVALTEFTIEGGGEAFGATGVADDDYRISDWTQDGVPLT